MKRCFVGAGCRIGSRTGLWGQQGVCKAMEWQRQKNKVVWMKGNGWKGGLQWMKRIEILFDSENCGMKERVE